MVREKVLRPALEELLKSLTEADIGKPEEALARIRQQMRALGEAIQEPIGELSAATLGALDEVSLACGAAFEGVDKARSYIEALAAGAEQYLDGRAQELSAAFDTVTRRIEDAIGGSIEDFGRKADALLATVNALDHSVRGLQNDLARSTETARMYGERAFGAASRLTTGGPMAAPSNVLKLYSAVTSAPELAALKADIDRIRSGYDELSDIIDTTETKALFNRLGDELKALGLSLPFDRIGDRLLPSDLSGLDIGAVFRNLGGAKLDGLFKGFKLPAGVREAIKVTHDFDKAQARAWVQLDINAPMPGRRSLFSVGPFSADFVDMVLTGRVRLEASKDEDRPTESGFGRIDTSIDIVVGGQSMLRFDKFALAFTREKGLEIEFDPKNIRLNPSFKFIQDFLSTLFPDEIGGLEARQARWRPGRDRARIRDPAARSELRHQRHLEPLDREPLQAARLSGLHARRPLQPVDGGAALHLLDLHHRRHWLHPGRSRIPALRLRADGRGRGRRGWFGLARLCCRPVLRPGVHHAFRSAELPQGDRPSRRRALDRLGAGDRRPRQCRRHRHGRHRADAADDLSRLRPDRRRRHAFRDHPHFEVLQDHGARQRPIQAARRQGRDRHESGGQRRQGGRRTGVPQAGQEIAGSEELSHGLARPVLHCLLDREPASFHPASAEKPIVFAVNLSLECPSASGSAAPIDDEEQEARLRFDRFLQAVQQVRFHVWKCVTGQGLAWVGKVDDQISETSLGAAGELLAWLDKEGRPASTSSSRYWSTSAAANTQEPTEITVQAAGAADRLRSAQSWNAPIAHKFGLTHLLRPASKGLGHHLVLPYFADPGEHPEVPTTAGTIADPNWDVSYDPLGGLGKVICRTELLSEAALPLDLPGEVDDIIGPEGFLKVDCDAVNLWRVARWFEERAATLLAVGPALASSAGEADRPYEALFEPSSVPAEPGTPSPIAVWAAAAGLCAALDTSSSVS